MVLDDKKPVTEKRLYDVLGEFFEKILAPEFEKIHKQAEDIKEIKSTLHDVLRRVIDLEHDTVTDGDFKKLEARVTKLEQS